MLLVNTTMKQGSMVNLFLCTEIKTLLTSIFHTLIYGGDKMDTTLQSIIEIALQQGIWAAL